MRAERQTLRQKHLRERKALENHIRNLERLARDQGDRLLALAAIADELKAKADMKPKEEEVVKSTAYDRLPLLLSDKTGLPLTQEGLPNMLAVVLAFGAILALGASVSSAQSSDYDFTSRLQSLQEQRAILRGEDPADAVIRAQINPFINPCK